MKRSKANGTNYFCINMLFISLKTILSFLSHIFLRRFMIFTLKLYLILVSFQFLNIDVHSLCSNIVFNLLFCPGQKIRILIFISAAKVTHQSKITPHCHRDFYCMLQMLQETNLELSFITLVDINIKFLISFCY